MNMSFEYHNPPKLFSYIVLGQWVKVKNRAMSHPTETIWYCKRHKTTALHLICQKMKEELHFPPFDVVKTVIISHIQSRAPFQISKGDWSILHYAVNSIPHCEERELYFLNIITFMIKQAKNIGVCLCSMVDSSNCTPLHLVCRSGFNARVIKLLVRSYPEAIFVMTRTNSSPIHYFHRMASIFKVDIERFPDLKQSQEIQIWNSLAALLFDPKMPELHRMLDILDKMTLPSRFISVVVKVLGKSQRSVVDDKLRRSIDILVNSNQICKRLGESNLNAIISPHLAATKTAQPYGAFPLMIAIEHGLIWENGLKSIYNAAPFVATYFDRRTLLYPFMLAASHCNIHDDEDKDYLSIVYNLLKASAHIALNTKNTFIEQII